jgi:hypothetical protein
VLEGFSGVGERVEVKGAHQRESIALAADDDRRLGGVRGELLCV